MYKNIISSDDPNALQLLKEKLEALQNYQDQMKSVNRIVKSKRANYPQEERINDIMKMFPKSNESSVKQLFVPDFCGRVGFPDYKLTNNNAGIRSVKQRIADLERRSQEESSEEDYKGVTITDNVEDNRLQLFFPDKPSSEIRSMLKSSGFRWSPTNGCWQSYRGKHPMYNAKNVIDSWSKEEAMQETS